MGNSRSLDLASIATIVITLVLFVVAVFAKGLTHDLLLEAAVFLVSVKLILMSQKNSVMAKKIAERLDEINERLAGGGR